MQAFFINRFAIVKILILGSGQVGANVAENLAMLPNNDVTVIDINEATLRHLGSKLDIQTLAGNAASPKVLAQAGAEDADLLLALTKSDETNLVACRMAEVLFNIPSRIARIRQRDFGEYAYAQDDDEEEEKSSLDLFNITDSISPEQLVTEQVVSLLEHTNALQVLRFAEDKVRMLVVRSQKGGLLVGRPIEDINAHLPEGVDCQICAIYRNNRLIVPNAATVLIEGDEVFFLAASEHVDTIMREIRPHSQKTRRVMIAGGGSIGYRVAKQMENHLDIKIIETHQGRAEWLAEQLDRSLVLNGNASDESLLEREYIDETDVFCALTNDDEANIMSALLAKKLGAKRVMAIINRSSYVDLLEGNTIDIVISPHLITIGSILAHVRLGDVVAVNPVRRGSAEAIEVVLHGNHHTSQLVGRMTNAVKLPEGCHFAAIVRGDEVIMGHKDTVLEEGDRIIFFVSRRRVVRELEKLIQVKIGFFA